MKRKSVFLAIIGIAVMLSLTGCTPKSGAAAGSATLRVIINNLNVKLFAKEIGESYVAKQANLNFEIIDVPQDEWRQKIQVMLSGGDDVDVIYVGNNEQYLQFVKNGQITDVTDLYTRDGIDRSRFRGVDQRLSINGRIYGMPYETAIWIMFYNKDLFDKQGVPYPPSDGNWTWDDYRRMLLRLTHGEGANKVYGGFHMQWNSCVQNITVQSGRHITTERDYSFMKYAYDLVTGMQNEGTIIPYALIQSNNLRYESAFLQQQIATLYMGNWQFNPMLEAYNSGLVNFDWDVCVAPYPPDGRNGQVVGTGFIASINSKAANPDHAWGYLKALTSEEGTESVARHGLIPVLATEETYQRFISAGLPAGVMDALKYDELQFEVAIHDLAGMISTVLTEEHQLMLTNSISVEQGISNMTRRSAPIWADYDAGLIE